MNLLKRFALLFITLLFLLPAALKAEIWTAETLPMVHLQDRSQFVCNPDGEFHLLMSHAEVPKWR